MAAAVVPSDAVQALIDSQLIRHVRDAVRRRCDVAILSLFLALVDGWLRSCEEFARRGSAELFANDVAGFESAYQNLMVPGEDYRFDNLVCLFDTLSPTGS